MPKFSDEVTLFSHIADRMAKRDLDAVICPVISHWHAVGADALIYRLSTELGGMPSALIVITAHPKDGFLIDRNDFAYSGAPGMEFCFLEPRPSMVGVYRRASLRVLLGVMRLRLSRKRGRKTLQIASLRSPNLKFLRVFSNGRLAARYQPIFSIIEEGFGTYMSGRAWWPWLKVDLRHWGRGKTRVKAEKLRLTMVPARLLRLAVFRLWLAASSYTERAASNAALRHVHTVNRALFKVEQGRLRVNDEIAEDYRHVLEQRARQHPAIEKKMSLAMVLTQPISEYGMVPLAHEMGVISSVISVLVESGFNVLLKPHPRETPGKYDLVHGQYARDRVKMQHQSMPAEELLPVLDPACVVGFTTTTLPVASALFHVPAISLVDVMWPGAGAGRIPGIVDEFKKLTWGLCYQAGSLDELRRILASILSKKCTEG